LLYNLLHFPAKIALLIWCKYLRINNTDILKSDGPLLIAANHPNSFLDAILLSSIFKQPIYSLARGDAFKNNFIAKILRALKMFPVYRVSEGVENLEENYSTFKDCIDIFKKNGIVLIFSEGKCINEWHLRPLKKGTARLAITAWEQNIPLQIIPLGINYHSFSDFGKIIHLNFGETITKENIGIKNESGFGATVQHFNSVLKSQLESLVYEIPKEDKIAVQSTFSLKQISIIKKILLFIPAMLGYVFHAPLYLPIKHFAIKRFSKIDHYDSVVVGLLFVLHPIYLVLLFFILSFFIQVLWASFIFILFPFFGWSYALLKKSNF
jgi:1-acyl-sn-glycerol-3-phosphate acyltransferase